MLLLMALFGYNLGWQTLPRWAPGHSTMAYITASALAVLLLLPCLLVHEMVHADAARRFGIQVQEIKLWALGGTTQMGTPSNARATMVIAASGPLASILLGGAALGVSAALQPQHAEGNLWSSTFVWLSAVNLVVGLFNLLPVSPLDGGRILQAFLWWRTGDRDHAERAAELGGQAMGGLIVLLGTYLLVQAPDEGAWLLVLGFFIAVSAELERRRTMLGIMMRGVNVAAAMSSPVQTALGWLTIHEFAETAAQHNKRSMIPLVDHDGRPTGVVALHRLVTVPTDLRRTVQMHEVATPLQYCQVASPGEPLVTLLDRLDTPDTKVLVINGDRLVGIVTDHDIIRLIQRRRWPPLRLS
ncbi:site-2 protease family protein [Streptacidiphilus sp. EB129]|uniref:site-2 protease family protein n=1 Tax=Streptacidiphilus sp. EB129 TaxID=3156262 RepID=UPI0035124794